MSNNAVGGLSDDELALVRKLKGQLQTDMPDTKHTNKSAVMYAVRNELQKQEHRLANAEPKTNE